MSFLRNILTGAVTIDLDPQDDVYRTLVKQKTTKEEKVTPDAGVVHEGSAGYTVSAGEPIWEDIPQARITSTTPKVAVAVIDAGAVAASVLAELTDGLDKDITITAAAYVPNAAVKGAATNNRLLTVVAGTETAAPVVAAKLEFGAGVNAEANAEKPLTLEEASKLKVASGQNLVAESVKVGTGIVEPGGLVLVTFTSD